MSLPDYLTAILDSANIGIWHQHVPSGRVIRNEVFMRLIQASTEELEGGLFVWADRIHPADRAQVLLNRQQLLSGQLDSYWTDYRVRCTGGGWASLRGRVAVSERDGAGNPVWISGVVLDVSGERELERRMHAIFDRPFQFVGLLTPEGILLETNRSSVRDSGKKLEEVLGKAFWEGPFFAHSTALQAQIRDGIARAARGELIRFEIRNPDKDGRTRTVDFTLTPLRDDDGNIVNVVPEGRDITDLAAAREALRAAEQRLHTAAEAANIGLWDTNVLTGEIWVSDQWGSMLGYGANELPTTIDAAFALLHPDDLPRIQQSLKTLQTVGPLPAFDLKYRMRAKDGSWRWIHAKGRCVDVAPDGQVLRQTGITMDVTDRNAAEERLAASERLESIGRLAAGVAHEINTPIQYVNDSLYFIREGLREFLAYFDNPEHAAQAASAADLDLSYLQQNLPDALDRAVDGLARVAEIVRSMKEFSHADPTAMSPVDLNRAIQSTLVVATSEYKYVADVKTDFGDLPPVTCHGSRINQVILNLVVNAAHAIADRVKDTAQRGLITIKTYRDDHEIVICIGDTGTGIPESVRNRIFEPFFSTKEVGRGTGQGLAIARSVVHGHGGSIVFQTELNQGTTFIVRLPIEQPQDQAATVAA